MAVVKRGRGFSQFLSLVVAVVVATGLTAVLLALLPAGAATAQTAQPKLLPTGFKDSVIFSDLWQPTSVQFAKDGRVFVAEKNGVVKVFDNLSDTTPTTFADLNKNVYNFWDRGMLGMALDPNFPTNPYVYVLYTHDAEVGGTAPKYGTPGAYEDPCPTPPGATDDGCVVSGRLSRLQADVGSNTMTGSEQVLIEDWCQQYPTHSIGSLAFGPDGALYVSGGEGASFTFTDYGQDGNPLNPCGDPPGGVGATLKPPTAEGGALRSQDLRTSGDPVSLDGTILRVDPTTGAGLSGNPLYSSSDPNARRIIASGLRNPFRFTVRPGTSEIWAGDVGWNRWEEIERISGPTDSTVDNFGWPCYEGSERQEGYDAANLNICENLYGAANAVTEPYYAYDHAATVVAGETCPSGTSAITGLAFYQKGQTGTYPDEYDGSLFFTDFSRECIWAMKKGTNGLPDPATLTTFATGVRSPVNLQIGPKGDLFYVNLWGGTINRIEYASGEPTAAATANPTNGPAPLTVSFDGTGSTDPDAGDTLSYAWDLDGDGAYDDSTEPKPTRTYKAGDTQVDLEVTDSQGLSDTLDQKLTISSGNAPPDATINTPSASTTWKVGDTISFSGSAMDKEEGTLPASALSWKLIMHHCPADCHEHQVQEYTGVANGSFVAPDHDYPSHLELRLTATDSGGLQNTKSVTLNPKTVELTFDTSPSGLNLVVGSSGATTPFKRTVIVGSANSVSAVSPQTNAGNTCKFSKWSDRGAQTHTITAPASSTTYTATYRCTGPGKK